MDLLAIVGLIVVIYFLIYMICPWFLECDLNLALHEKFGKSIRSLEEKVVWITGASSGIGEHLAYVLADAGCNLVLSARRKEELDRVKANCLRRNLNLNDSHILVIPLDICKISNHETAFKEVISKLGRLDILVNNAGRSQRAQWEQIELSVDKEMFDLNVFSQISLSRLVGKYFLEVGAGHLVVTSSFAGLAAVPYSGTYCATKHALHGYFKSFMIEKLGQNVPVTMICPGPVQTDFLSVAYTDKFGETYGENTKVSVKNKVSVERCAVLMGIAIANQLPEVWISKPMVLQLLYLNIYYPNIGTWIFKVLGPTFLQRLRDDKAKI
ncbi:dehydrogenase/reductase SDR family member 7 [Hylaeus volcanicus]|uniref:dehydrogenase/reductase SDR family member 7 n=1 Tax=Hylaeus volcanicus TaxID=313075 RepID=UPI0023B87D47|nr:dehydrogenase/reductase SDR family member 7 [Hylaeus volcanicus]